VADTVERKSRGGSRHTEGDAGKAEGGAPKEVLRSFRNAGGEFREGSAGRLSPTENSQGINREGSNRRPSIAREKREHQNSHLFRSAILCGGKRHAYEGRGESEKSLPPSRRRTRRES